jgi:hypothetical protein
MPHCDTLQRSQLLHPVLHAAELDRQVVTDELEPQDELHLPFKPNSASPPNPKYGIQLLHVIHE